MVYSDQLIKLELSADRVAQSIMAACAAAACAAIGIRPGCPSGLGRRGNTAGGRISGFERLRRTAAQLRQFILTAFPEKVNPRSHFSQNFGIIFRRKNKHRPPPGKLGQRASRLLRSIRAPPKSLPLEETMIKCKFWIVLHGFKFTAGPGSLREGAGSAVGGD